MGEDHDKETNYFDTDFPCHICGKWRRSEEDLAYHLKKHEVCTTAPTVPPKSIQCNFCTEMFLSIRDLMVHKKKEHVDKVSACRNHTNGTCDFGDLQCWFSHANQTSSMTFKCNHCDNSFSSYSDMLRHRKQEHATLVPACRNHKNGECQYNEYKCWVIHNEIKVRKAEEKDEIIQNMFNFMEKITERISDLENK